MQDLDPASKGRKGRTRTATWMLVDIVRVAGSACCCCSIAGCAYDRDELKFHLISLRLDSTVCGGLPC